MESAQYLEVVARRWGLIVSAMLAGIAAVLLSQPAKPIPEYQATNTLVIATAAEDAEPLHTPATLAFLVRTGEVPVRVATAMGYDGDPAVLAAKVVATHDPDLGTVQITAVDRRPDVAVALADAFSLGLREFLADQQEANYQEQIEAASRRVDQLASKANALSGAGTGTGPQAELARVEREAILRQYGSAYDRLEQVRNQPRGLNLIELTAKPAAVAKGGTFGIASSLPGRMAIVGFVALLLGTAIAFLVDRLDTRLHTKQQAEEAFGLPVIAEIPRSRRPARRGIALLRAPNSAEAAAYRQMRASVLFMQPRRKRLVPVPFQVVDSDEAPTASRVILVTSPGHGEGKTTTVANMAAAFAAAGTPVLVLNCDYSRPELQRILDVEPGPGLSMGFRHGRTPGLPVRQLARRTSIPSVWMVTDEPTAERPAELIANMPLILAEARKIAAVVVIDTGPVLHSSEASELAPWVDAVVLTCRVGSTTTDPANRASEQLDRIGAPLLGVILVGAGPVSSAGGSLRKRSAKAQESARASGFEELAAEASPDERGSARLAHE